MATQTPSLAITASSLANLALVIPQTNLGYQPTQPSDGTTWSSTPPALLFHYEGENTVNLTSDITDHYVENNTPIQDQVALRPVRITVHGFIGELNDVAPIPVLNSIVQTLTTFPLVTAFTPPISVTAQQQYEQAQSNYNSLSTSANQAVSAWSSITNGQSENTIGNNGLGSNFNASTGSVANNQTLQQIMFQQLYGYWSARTYWTVQTPWAIFQNMIIEEIKALQGEETRVITDFYVTFKQIRTASTTTTEAPVSVGRAGTQSADAVNAGTTNGASTTNTVSTVIGNQN